MQPTLSVFGILASVESLTPARGWLERLAFIVPGPLPTRSLLVADVACLVALGLSARRPRIGVPVALGVGFIALNVLDLMLTDFYLGLAAFHLGVGVTTSLFARGWRWLGIALLGLALLLGAVTGRSSFRRVDQSAVWHLAHTGRTRAFEMKRLPASLSAVCDG